MPELANPDPDAPSLVGGEYGAPAFQSVETPFAGQRLVSPVPRATLAEPAPLPADFGAFDDLVPREQQQVGGVDFGVFSDLIPKPPPSPTPETDQAAAEPSVLDQAIAFARKPSPEWMQRFERPLAEGLTPEELRTQLGRLYPPAAQAIEPHATSEVPILSGAVQGAIEATAPMISPAGVALLGVIPEGIVGKGVAGAFTAQGLSQFPELYRQYQATDDPQEKAKILTMAGISVSPALGLLARGRVPEASKTPSTGAKPRPPTGPEPIIAAEPPAPEPAPAPAAAKPPAVALTERTLPEGDVTGTHAVDIANPAGDNIGYIGGNLTDQGFEVNISHIDKGERGKGYYQDAIQQMADKYGQVKSDADLAPAAETAWQKVGAEKQPDGSYVLKGGEEIAIEEGKQPEGGVSEHPGDGEVGAPAETGGGGGAGERAAVAPKEEAVTPVEWVKVPSVTTRGGKGKEFFWNTKGPYPTRRTVVYDNFKNKWVVQGPQEVALGGKARVFGEFNTPEQAKRFVEANPPAPVLAEPRSEDVRYMHPSERPEVPKITETPVEPVPPELPTNDWTTATEPIEKQAGKLRLKADQEGGFVDLSGVADIGRRIYERGVDFARWSGEMIRQLGEKIRPHLQTVWDFLTGKHFLPGTAESGAVGKVGRRKAAFGAKLFRGRTELDALTGKWSAKRQQSTAEVERINKEFKRAAPTDRIQNAMSAWAEARGDQQVLKQQEQVARGKMFRQAAKDAQRLTPEQQALALKGRQTLDIMGTRLQHYGVLGQFRQDYVPHIFDVGQKFTGIGSSRLVSKFKFAKAAKYQSFFEADQQGVKPKTMAMGNLVGFYVDHANQVISDRQFIQGVQTGRSIEGEPLAIPRGRAQVVQGTGGQAVLANPHSFRTAKDAQGNLVDQMKYKVDAEQPALRKWLFAGKDTQGKPIFMEDDLAIHPELAKRLRAMVGRSRIRQWYDQPSEGGLTAIPKAIAKNLDTAQAVMKREMFGLLAPFHQVQEGTHAVGHTVNPLFGLPKMDTMTPAMMDAAEHGLILRSERGASAAAMEGVGGKSVFLSKVMRKYGMAAGRKVANVLDGYQDYLFEHYIPALKFKTYGHMVERNMKTYAKELKSGEVTEADVKMLSAEQSNAAYGKLNLALLDRSPTLQHILQGLLIAPDFLEARGKFVGQAAKSFFGSKAGQEQLRAIAVLSMTQAGMAYVITKGLGGEWDPKKPFEVQNADGTRSYYLRSVPEDFARLVLQGSDKRREFISARLNPALNTAWQMGVSGRNYRGEKITTADSLWEFVNNYIPIMARALPGIRELTKTSRDSPISPWERFAGSAGIKVSRTSPITKTYQLATDWKEKQGIPRDVGTYPVSKYQQLRYALEDNNPEKAADEFQKLLNDQPERKKVIAGFHESLNHPFTESLAMDKKFRDSLPPRDRATYDAAKDRRHEIMRRFNEMKALEVRAAAR